MKILTKTETAIALFEARQHKKALRIFKTFRSAFTAAEKRDIEIAYECYTGKLAFYKSLGIDTDACIAGASVAVQRYINQRKQSSTL